MYVLVAITGYLTFGNEVNGNIVSMCKASVVPNSQASIQKTYSQS